MLYRHGWCGAKALSPRHAIVAVVKHGHLMTVILYHLEVMKPTFFLEVISLFLILLS